MAKGAVKTGFVFFLLAFILLQGSPAFSDDYHCGMEQLGKIIREVDRKVGEETAKVMVHTGVFAATVACAGIFEGACHAALDAESGPMGIAMCIAGSAVVGELCHGACESAKNEKGAKAMAEVITAYFNKREKNLIDSMCKYSRGSILVKNDLHDDEVEFRAVISGAFDAHSHPGKVHPRGGYGMIHPNSHDRSFEVKAKINRHMKRDIHLSIHGVVPGRDKVVVYYHAGHHHIKKY